jgi:hypothetical protein
MYIAKRQRKLLSPKFECHAEPVLCGKVAPALDFWSAGEFSAKAETWFDG